MPSFNIVRENKRNSSFRTKSIIDRYELKIEHENLCLNGSIDIEDRAWSIGLIVGASGSGKSTIAKEVFKNDYISDLAYSANKTIIDEMPQNKSIDEITQVFNTCGLGTAWSWLKPYEILSTGEKMRVDLARCILEDRELFVFDEFTSVVDRNVAKIASFCVSKAIKKSNKKFVAVSCHRDVIEWLEPDWIYDTDKQQFFFAQINTKDPKSKFQFSKHLENTGRFLENITI